MAHRLWRAALDLADAWRQIRPTPRFLEDLPPVVRPWAQGEWPDRFVSCFEALTVRIAAGEGDQETLASCTGEELALHLVIARGGRRGRRGRHGRRDARRTAGARSRRHRLELMRDLLFVDHDLLLLFEPSLDGIEGEEASLGPWVEPVSLHPRDWFLPFEHS